MECELTVEDGTTYNYLDVCSRNYHHFKNRWSFKLAKRFDPARLVQYNPLGCLLCQAADASSSFLIQSAVYLILTKMALKRGKNNSELNLGIIADLV